ncbi:MAG: hypothetical protein AABX40_04330, partial [Candidatus Hydrothermarchaeota archaeon]
AVRILSFLFIFFYHSQGLQPQTSIIWHADEMMVKAGGKYKWLWHMLDAKTPYRKVFIPKGNSIEQPLCALSG